MHATDEPIAPRREPTLPELLADPLTRALMKADHIDVEAVEGLLHEVAGRLRGGADLGMPAMIFDERPHPAAPWRSLIDLPYRPMAARFMHEAARPKAPESACGRICSW
jgi:hypothetical protein